MSAILNWLLLFVGVISGALGALLLKMGAAKLPITENILIIVYSASKNIFIISGLLLYIIPSAIWIWLLRVMPLTVLQPALSLTYVVSALLAMFFLHEEVNICRWIRIFVIMSGVLLVGKS